MKLNNPQLRDELCAQYVLGTLTGAARQRFSTYLRDDSDLQQRVAQWEQRLQPLAAGITPVEPSAATWRALSARLGFEEPAVKRESWWSWRPALAGFALLLIVSGVLLREPIRQNLLFLPDVEVAFVDESQGPLWKVEADTGNDRLVVTALGDVPVDRAKAMELWLLRDNDQPPVSLGLLPVRNGAVISVHAAASLRSGTGFAVSLEPAGGSPTGLPTGPVLYVQSLTS